jgi:hypothetical protein
MLPPDTKKAPGPELAEGTKIGREVIHLTAEESVSTAVKHIPDVDRPGTVGCLGGMVNGEWRWFASQVEHVSVTVV